MILLLNLQKNPCTITKNELTNSIKAFKNRKKYKIMDEEILKQIPDEDLLQAIFDYICDEVIQNDWKNAYTKVKALPKGFQHIYSLWVLEGEVNNGGFNQYFFNSSGQFVDEAYDGCIAIGAAKNSRNCE